MNECVLFSSNFRMTLRDQHHSFECPTQACILECQPERRARCVLHL